MAGLIVMNMPNVGMRERELSFNYQQETNQCHVISTSITHLNDYTGTVLHLAISTRYESTVPPQIAPFMYVSKFSMQITRQG